VTKLGGDEEVPQAAAPRSEPPSEQSPQPSVEELEPDHARRRVSPFPPLPTTDSSYELPYGSLSQVGELRRQLLGERTLLLGRTARDRFWSFVGTAAVTLLAAVLRLWHLGYPKTLVFDETHYVKHAWTLLQIGYESQWPEDIDAAFASGATDAFETEAAYISHPQTGKWLIAIGMRLLGGDNPWGWRIMSALLGAATVWLVARAGRRLFASSQLGVLAGLLFALDGQAIVHSRTALLDGFLTFFLVAAFLTFLIDRHDGRERLAVRLALRLDDGKPLTGWGPRLGFRWWRLATGILLGLACSVKWSGIYFLAVFGILMVLDDALARRTVGVKHWLRAGVFRDGIPAFILMVPTAFVVYVASWFSWFAHSGSYHRQWAENHPGEGVQWLPEALRSLLKYHTDIWHSMNNLIYEHPYGAHPIGWTLQLHPTVYYRENPEPAQELCGADSCVSTIVGVGNPILWWGATAILVFLVIAWWSRLDWRFVLATSGLVAGWLPWFAYAKRVVFTFYSIAFAPWMVFIFIYPLAIVLERWDTYSRAEQTRITVFWSATLVAYVAVSAFLYPIWIGMPLPEWLWFWRSWLPPNWL
jgi:dolichyl-phosphate-mannose-protein mannosyltransferase